jgi:hypothetical protein
LTGACGALAGHKEGILGTEDRDGMEDDPMPTERGKNYGDV